MVLVKKDEPDKEQAPMPAADAKPVAGPATTAGASAGVTRLEEPARPSEPAAGLPQGETEPAPEATAGATELYAVRQWNGLDNYACNLCHGQYATLGQERMMGHLRARHGIGQRTQAGVVILGPNGQPIGG